MTLVAALLGCQLLVGCKPQVRPVPVQNAVSEWAPTLLAVLAEQGLVDATNGALKVDAATVTKLNLEWSGVRALKGITAFPNLKELSVFERPDQYPPPMIDLEGIEGLKELELLHLQGVAPIRLAPTSDLPKLEWLSLNSLKLPDDFPQSLPSGIRGLSLAKTDLATLTFVIDQPALHCLELYGTPLHDVAEVLTIDAALRKANPPRDILLGLVNTDLAHQLAERQQEPAIQEMLSLSAGAPGGLSCVVGRNRSYGCFPYDLLPITKPQQ